MLSTIPPLFMSRHSTPIMQCNCCYYWEWKPNSHTPLPLQLVNKIDAILLDFVHFPFAILFTPHHFLISTPFSCFIFPRRFLHSTLLTTQTKTLPQPHKLSSINFNYIIPVTFAENAIRFPTSTPLRLASTPPPIIDFRPTFLISTLITFRILLCC